MANACGAAVSPEHQALGQRACSPWAGSGRWPRALAMSATYDFDLVCIGSGPAGQRAAVQAAKLGQRAAVIEKRRCVGGVCIDTGTIPINAAIPGATNEPAVLVVGVVMAALVAASLLLTPNRLSKVVGLSAMAIGFHSLALPIAALISFLVGGARAGDLRTVALSVGGLVVGVFLVFVGDRVLRRRRRSRSRARFDLSRPHA